MPVTIACIAGEEVHRQWQAGRIEGDRIGPRNTPFGESGEIFSVSDDQAEFLLLSRHRPGLEKTAPRLVNDRANIYSLKDLGAEAVIAWGPAGAVTHNVAVGDLLILSDVIDQTFLREKTFFEDSPLGYLRQFPVFCPRLRRALGDVLHEMKLVYHGTGVAAVREGPRLETPAEVRMLATTGAELLTHAFVPEVFLAKELQLCYAGLCYVVNYAETGSHHRPFPSVDLFGQPPEARERQRLESAVGAMSEIARRVADAMGVPAEQCECAEPMARQIEHYDLSDDWHQWFA
ncbi:MAG: MTAP family purine nucleoside phosphorylase [Planctomycetota bacterium]